MKSHYHVIILGAGVSGLASFLFLKKNGIDDILVIDKNDRNIHKACSGILTERSIKLLDEIGINPSNYIKWSGVNAYYNNQFSKSFPETIYAYQNSGLNRVSLDEEMFEKCKQENMEIVENVKDIIIDEKHKLINFVNYDYLIDARGFSVIANSYKKKIIGIEAKINDPKFNENKITPNIHLFDDLKGYGWVVSYNHELTIGFTNLYSKNIDLKSRLTEFALQNGINLNDYEVDIRAGFVPIKPLDKLYKQNTLYIGDRAGLNDPLTQEGICYALLSSKLAAITIKNEDLKYYQNSMRPFISSLKKANSYRKLFFKKSIQSKLWNISQKHGFTNYVFQKYSELEFFDYTKLIKYHKEYKKAK